MRLGDVRGIAAAQRVTRAVVHEVAGTLRAGDTERGVAERLEGGQTRWLDPDLFGHVGS